MLRSVNGVGRYFHCMGCSRRLSVGGGRKAVCACLVVLLLIGTCLYGAKTNSPLPYLAFPILAALASLLVCWHARLRIVDCGERWFSMFYFGIMGLIVGAFGYAIIP
jgi:hypothetical protein